MFLKSGATLVALAAIVGAIAVPASARLPMLAVAPLVSSQPHHATMCEQAFTARTLVVVKHGKRAPGRNICRFGVKYSNGIVRAPTLDQKGRYLRQLRLLLAPDVAVGPPAQMPAGTLTAHAAFVGYALPTYIVMCESGGVPTAVNNNNPSRPAGLYQIITSTWLNAGGGQYAPTADQATPAEQGIIAARIYDGGRGAGQWACS